MKPAKNLLLGATLLLAGLAVGCLGPAAQANFDRTLKVTGPARLYLSNGSGTTHIQAGPPGQVHIHGGFRMYGWVLGNPRRSAEELSRNPPIRQEGSLIHVGGLSRLAGNINYTIEVPPDTEVRVTAGSGDVSVAGVGGPVSTTVGSGNVTLTQIQGDVRTTAGSGDIRLDGIRGSADITAGSGDIEMKSIGGRVRVSTGSGDITLTSPGNAITIRNSSGDIHITGATADLRIRTASGTVTIAGSPSTGAYWELHTASGDVRLAVPTDASFRFDAQSRMGDIQSRLPMTILEQKKRELRAVIGQGAARVEIETASGDIRLNSSHR